MNADQAGNAVYRQATGITLTDVPDGAVVHDERGLELHFLNPVAAAIIMLCDGSLSAAAIARILHEEFALAEVPLPAVNSCLKQLLTARLITTISD